LHFPGGFGRLFYLPEECLTTMELNDFLQQLRSTPESITFADTIATIEVVYEFTPTAFNNGTLRNEAGQNNGSCKIFAFARLHRLSEAQTLNCFGDYYRKDILENPEGSDHQNIRNFMRTGWAGIVFEGEVLTAKQS